MSGPRDVVVIGAGHNGLTVAALLARRGRSVIVVEARDVVGGLAASEEFAPGYSSAGLLHDTTLVRRGLVEPLALDRHGLRWRAARPAVLALGGSGRTLAISADAGETDRELRAHSAKDADAFGPWRDLIDRTRGAISGFLDGPPVDLIDGGAGDAWKLLKRGLRVRRLGAAAMLDLLRLPPMSVADWLSEHFETDLLKAAIALPAVAGTFTGPRSPGSNAMLLMHECAAGTGVEGGGPALVAALDRAARAAGVEIRTSARVERILTDGDSARGVVLEGGEEIAARAVAASCDPRTTFLRLLPSGAIPWRLEHRIATWRARGTTAQVLIAVKAPVAFAGRPPGAFAFARTGDSLDAIEKAFDAVKYRRFSDTPVIDIHVPTIDTPGLAPAGHSVVSAIVHFAPYQIDGGWDESRRRRLGDRVVALIDQHCPGIASMIVAGEVLSPADIERRYGTTGGHIHHGEHAIDQILVRPAPECSRYRTPLRGLYLCGSGSHPGGGLTCAPGALAAQAIVAA